MIQDLIIAFGLAMDAFAVSIACGLNFKKPNWGLALRIGFFFGVFQGGMTLLGFLLGGSFTGIVQSVDHWIAFILLGYIGIKMFVEGFQEEKVEDELTNKKISYLALATSIDALAVGISLALVKDGNIISTSAVVASIALVLSAFGVIIGSFLGQKTAKYANFVGGIILCAIGLNVLLSHLG